MDFYKPAPKLTIPSLPSDNIKIFILSYICVIWRRIWITSIVYIQHNNLKDVDRTLLENSMRYNIFSELGLSNNIREYIVKSLDDGFLMPQYYEKDRYVTRAVKLYKKAFKIIKENGIEEEILFIQDNSKDIYNIIGQNIQDINDDIQQEIQDLSQLINDSNTNDNRDDDNCYCKLCNIIRSWDINSNLIYSEDDFQNIIMKALLVVLERHYEDKSLL